MPNIFIVHYKKLTERKDYLKSALHLFVEHNICEFVEDFDRDLIETYDTMYHNNVELWKERTSGIYNYTPEYRDLKSSEICNSLSHIDAMKRMLNQNLPRAIILEDDVIVNDDFLEKINNLIGILPHDYDFAFFGTSYDIAQLDNITFNESIQYDENLYKKKIGITRCVDAYLVSEKGAKKIVDEINEICLPFDFELNYFFKKLNMNVYWYDPGFISQGSQTGQYKSSIR